MADAPEESDDILETDIDRLFKLVRKRKKITFGDAARELGEKRAEIVEWGGILEDHKLVNLHYPVFGEPELRVVQKAKRDMFADKKGKSAEEEEEKEPGKPLPLGKMFGYGMLALVTIFLAYIYYVDSLYALNIRARINQYITISRDFAASAVPGLDSLFRSLDSIFMGQFYFLLFPIIIIVLVALFVSRMPGREKAKGGPEDRGKPGEGKKGESKQEGNAPEGPAEGSGRGKLASITRLLRR